MSINLSPNNSRTLYERMVMIRQFEEKVAHLFEANEMVGDVHLSIGQEAVAVGVCAFLGDQDWAIGSHRSHGLAIAKGVPLAPLFGELLGRQGGVCRGKGGSMHIAFRDRGFLGAFPIVGGGVPLAAGAALSAKRTAAGNVAVAFFGDGALNQGLTLETLNLAAVWELPLLFVLENNHWAETTSTTEAFRVDPLARRAEGFGVASESVDGQDLTAVLSATESALDHMRTEGGPFFLECLTERFRGHYEGDPGGYRSADEEVAIRQRDPISEFGVRARLDSDFQADIDSSVAKGVADALEAAKAYPEPDLADLLTDVWSAS